jgi:hypothetical protein
MGQLTTLGQTTLLPGCLVEPDADVGLPMLAEVDVRDDIVVFYHQIYKIIK